jgi:hypothetical protein
MPRHDVTFTLPERRLGNSDAIFTVQSDDMRLGTLKVSKGALVWCPANKKRGFYLRWDDFDRVMRRDGHREPPRRPD